MFKPCRVGSLSCLVSLQSRPAAGCLNILVPNPGQPARAPHSFCFFPEALRRVLLLKAAANFTCQLLMPTCRELLHMPTSHANLSRVTSPANFSCQLVEGYFTCQLLMPTCRELLHLPTSHVNFLRVTSPANFSCQLFGCYLILLKAQANLSDFSCQLFGCYLILLKAQANLSGVTSLS